MELWQVGLFIGVGPHEPVIRGSRSLTLPSDDPGPRTGSGARLPQPRRLDPTADRSLKARIAAYRQKGDDES